MSSVGLLLLAAHLLADFPLQTDEMAARKFDSALVRTSHVGAHIVLTVIALAIAGVHGIPALVITLFVAVTHWLIDTRRWAESKDGFEDYPIWVDQSLHITALALAPHVAEVIV